MFGHKIRGRMTQGRREVALAKTLQVKQSSIMKI